VKDAIRLAALGATEMAGYISRWDRRYLKSYEGMAGHRFNVTTLACEPNVWGVGFMGRGTVKRRLNALGRASDWLAERGMTVQVDGPFAANRRRSRMPDKVDARIVCGSSERLLLNAQSADLIWTDPPYHDDVRYGELSGPLRAWAGHQRRLTGEAVANSLRDADYEARLTRIFKECHRVLRHDGHLMLTYANREPQAWLSLFDALRKAGFRACGFQVVHAENETDHAKRSVRACTLDIVLDLVRADQERPVEVFRPKHLPKSDQERFIFEVGSAFLARVQPTCAEPSAAFLDRLAKMDFLKTPRPATATQVLARTAGRAV
jgi:SAM-dependent methyltransferase